MVFHALSNLMVAGLMTAATPGHVTHPIGGLFQQEFLEGVACFDMPDVSRFFAEVYNLATRETPIPMLIKTAESKGIDCTLGRAMIGRLGPVNGPDGTIVNQRDGVTYQVLHYVYFSPQGGAQDLYMFQSKLD